MRSSMSRRRKLNAKSARYPWSSSVPSKRAGTEARRFGQVRRRALDVHRAARVDEDAHAAGQDQPATVRPDDEEILLLRIAADRPAAVLFAAEGAIVEDDRGRV